MPWLAGSLYNACLRDFTGRLQNGEVNAIAECLGVKDAGSSPMFLPSFVALFTAKRVIQGNYSAKSGIGCRGGNWICLRRGEYGMSGLYARSGSRSKGNIIQGCYPAELGTSV